MNNMTAITNDPDGVTYWHGTHSLHLGVGDVLVPSAQRTDLADAPTTDEEWVPAMFTGLYSVDRVYMTTEREYARAWVARAGGALLRVRPHGTLGPDPDTGDSGGVTADSATILEVVERPVQMSTMQIRKAFARGDLSRYDDKGYLQPSEEVVGDLVTMGLTAEKCRTFGRWINPHRLIFNPEIGDFDYETNDFNLAYNMLLQTLADADGITTHDAAERLKQHPRAIRQMEERVARRPLAWL
jgi:hypothetical protein